MTATDTPTEALVLGRTPDEVASTVTTIARSQGYSAAPSGPNALLLARRTTPRAALIAGVLLAPLFGLGLVILKMARKDQSGSVLLERTQRGVVVRLVGLDAPELLAALLDGSTDPTASAPYEQSVVGSPAGDRSTPSAPAPVRRLVTDVPFGDATIVRGVLAEIDTGGTHDAGRPGDRRSPTLMLPGGRRIVVDHRVLIGRDPVLDDAPVVGSAQVDDQSVSKTHAVIEPDGDGVRLTDLHSTNGTTVFGRDLTTVCTPNVALRISDDAEIRFGSLSARLSFEACARSPEQAQPERQDP